MERISSHSLSVWDVIVLGKWSVAVDGVVLMSELMCAISRSADE